jgi:hypothetical protein
MQIAPAPFMKYEGGIAQYFQGPSSRGVVSATASSEVRNKAANTTQARIKRGKAVADAGLGVGCRTKILLYMPQSSVGGVC